MGKTGISSVNGAPTLGKNPLVKATASLMINVVYFFDSLLFWPSFAEVFFFSLGWVGPRDVLSGCLEVYNEDPAVLVPDRWIFEKI